MDLPHLRGSLWLVFTGRPGQWMWLARDDRVLFHRRLAGMGCERTLTALFVNAHVVRYACPAGPRSAPRSSPPDPAPAADAAERP